MRCPHCKVDDDRVIDSRSSNDGGVIRRRRICNGCGRRFTTYERIEEAPLRVIKRSGRRTHFDRAKLLRGLQRACEKCDVSEEELETIAQRVEEKVASSHGREVTSDDIGTFVLDELRKLDQVAWVRFASVFRKFNTAEDFSLAISTARFEGRAIGEEPAVVAAVGDESSAG